MFDLFNNSISFVKNLISGGSGKVSSGTVSTSSNNHANVVAKPSTPAASEFPKFTPAPAYKPYIAQWGDSPSTIAAGQAKNDAMASNTQKWADAQAKEVARAEAERKQRIAAEKAQKQLNTISSEYRKQSEASIKKYKDSQSGNFLSWATGGFVGEGNTRKFAEDQIKTLDRSAEAYDKKLNDFLSEQARRAAEIQGMKVNSQADLDKYNRLVDDFGKWEQSGIDDLNYTYAANLGMYQAYDKAARAPGDSLIAKGGQLFNAFGQTWLGQAAGNIFKYTLGSGDENIPSLTTLPSRAINWAGNMLNESGNKNLQDGTWVKGYQPGKNSWTQGFNQRNFNMQLPKSYSDSEFEKWLAGQDRSGLQSAGYDPAKIKELYRKMYKSQLSGDAMANNVAEFFADPLFLVSSSKTGKIGKWFESIGEAARTSKAGELFSKIGGKIADSKAFKWLGSEYKNRDMKYFDELATAEKRADPVRARYLAQLSAKERALAQARGLKFDDSILAEFKALADSGDDQAAKWLQKMKDGDFSAAAKIKNWTRAGGVGSNPRLQQLKSLADKYGDWAESQRLADNVAESATRFGKGKKKSFYAPYTSWVDDLDTYNFRKMKVRDTSKNPLRAQDLYRGITDRYITSGMKSNWTGKQTKYMDRLEREIGDLRRNYRRDIQPFYADARKLDTQRGTLGRYVSDRLNRKNLSTGQFEARTPLGRSLWNSSKDLAAAPVNLWKKSVLKYRPAWTVNNVAYNVPASVLAGGLEALPETAKLAGSKGYREAVHGVSPEILADLTGEFGRGYTGRNWLKRADSKLTKFYNRVENTSRLAAFKSLVAKGYSEEAALKRVNKYLFDYKTKNWEQPLKQIVPFWSWNKNLTKASVQMPLDRPLAAKLYNQLDRHQRDEFDREFAAVVPQLQSLGYSQAEIESIKHEQAKYFAGRLNVGNSWLSTPFNAFSEKGLSGFGLNPYLAAMGEASASVDSFGNSIAGAESTIGRRLLSKFPQLELGRKAYRSWLVDSGRARPERKYIGLPGSEGYGLTKEKQGYDSTKPNYVALMDPRVKLDQDALAFLGVPRLLEFDKDKLVEGKRLQKITDAYFSLNTKDLPFDQAEAARQAVFDKYGISADQFYKGVLSKYDSANTKRVKLLKEEAATKNKTLFEEYGRQPQGSRNLWAVNKLRELNKQGYFADNPFLKSFDWLSPEVARRADKQSAVTDAIRSGNWANYSAKFGEIRRSSPYQADGKHFKSAESMARFKEGQFWAEYAKAGKAERKKLLAQHPEYNRRADWTASQWRKWRDDQKMAERKKLLGWGDFGRSQQDFLASSRSSAGKYLMRRSAGRWLKVKYN